MSIVVPDEGKVEWLKRSLYANAGSEGLTLKLFQNNITPADTDTNATYTVATFTGYADKPLASTQAAGTWSVPVASGNIATSSYQTIQTWTATTDQTLYGWYMLFATSLKVAASQKFDTPRALIGANNDQISIPPRLQVNDF